MHNDPWFAGFADGEASFGISARKNPRYNGGVHYLPSCSIGLRDDDGPLLLRVQEAFGGNIHYHAGRVNMQNPVVRWTCARKDELQGLVEYFDRFPLRSKKARDYTIWRDAVHIYCSTGGIGHRQWRGQPPGLPELRIALMEGRRYRPT